MIPHPITIVVHASNEVFPAVGMFSGSRALAVIHDTHHLHIFPSLVILVRLELFPRLLRVFAMTIFSMLMFCSPWQVAMPCAVSHGFGARQQAVTESLLVQENILVGVGILTDSIPLIIVRMWVYSNMPQNPFQVMKAPIPQTPLGPSQLWKEP